MTSEEYYLEKLNSLDHHEERIALRAPVGEKVTHVHLIGVCGTAMGALAGLLVQAGYKVSGSDTGCYEPMKSLIEKLGITFYEGFDGKDITNADVVIVGNACGPTNAEAAHAREHHIPTLSLPEAVYEFFLKAKKSLVVAGTHGKTTTTGLVAHVLQSTGRDPSFLIGGVPQQSEHGFHVGSGEYFVIEGDEYDSAYFDKRPKFLHYAPHSAIITSIEFDHIDIYRDMEDYCTAFSYFADLIPAQGTLLVWGDAPETRTLAKKMNVLTYGMNPSNDVTCVDLMVANGMQEASLIYRGKKQGTFATPLSGEHNLNNVLAVFGLLLAEGLAFSEIAKGVTSYTGMKRRQEVVYDKKGITIIDDFAHHPTAVRETLKGLRVKYAKRRLIAVFEPRSNTSRRKIFEQPYAESFDSADMVFLKTPPLRHNDTPEDFLDANALTKAIGTRVSRAEHFEDVDTLLASLTPTLTVGDVVVIMSNGSFDGLYAKLLRALRA